jgi:hypothetical protein
MYWHTSMHWSSFFSARSSFSAASGPSFTACSSAERHCSPAADMTTERGKRADALRIGKQGHEE